MKKSSLTQLRPVSLTKAKTWQLLSLGLIVGGAILMTWGSWLLYQQQVEANTPPPAPIVNSIDRLPALTPTDVPSPTPRPNSTPVEPTAALQRVGDTIIIDPTPTPISETSPTASATPTLEPSPTRLPEPSPTSPPTSQPIAQENTSLEGNPLLVDAGAPAAADEAANSANIEIPPVEMIEVPLTRLVAETIKLDTPVVGVGWNQVVQNGVTVNVWNVAEYAAGWHQNSMLPGQGGNIVLSGHHNIKGEVFRDIVELEIGDAITLYVGDQLYNYTVNDKFIVKDKGEPQEVRIANARWIGPFEDERVTLITCWPYNNNTHRVIVIAKPV